MTIFIDFNLLFDSSQSERSYLRVGLGEFGVSGTLLDDMVERLLAQRVLRKRLREGFQIILAELAAAGAVDESEEWSDLYDAWTARVEEVWKPEETPFVVKPGAAEFLSWLVRFGVIKVEVISELWYDVAIANLLAAVCPLTKSLPSLILARQGVSSKTIEWTQCRWWYSTEEVADRGVSDDRRIFFTANAATAIPAVTGGMDVVAMVGAAEPQAVEAAKLVEQIAGACPRACQVVGVRALEDVAVYESLQPLMLS